MSIRARVSFFGILFSCRSARLLPGCLVCVCFSEPVLAGILQWVRARFSPVCVFFSRPNGVRMSRLSPLFSTSCTKAGRGKRRVSAPSESSSAACALAPSSRGPSVSSPLLWPHGSRAGRRRRAHMRPRADRRERPE
nr:hypothetical protein [Pandoravirus massiliensis]